MDDIALQLYTVRDLMTRDYEKTLREIAQIGYRAVELVYRMAPPAELRGPLAENNLRPISSHLVLDDLEAHPQQLFTDLQELGCAFAALAWVPEERRHDAEQVKLLAELLNGWGRLAQEEGIRFGYHNHAFEFEPLGDTTMFEILTSQTDPELVFFELDVYWLQRAGHDPAEMIRRFQGRVPLLHVKDIAPDGAFAPVGEGTLSWPPILQAARDAGTQWYVVEQDTSPDPLRDVRASLQNLQADLAASPRT